MPSFSSPVGELLLMLEMLISKSRSAALNNKKIVQISFLFFFLNKEIVYRRDRKPKDKKTRALLLVSFWAISSIFAQLKPETNSPNLHLALNFYQMYIKVPHRWSLGVLVLFLVKSCKCLILL